MTEIVELRTPITVAGHRVTQIELREPRVRDQLAVDAQGAQGDMQRDVALFALLSGLPPTTFHDLTLPDWNEVQRAYARFFRAAAGDVPAGGAGAGAAPALVADGAAGAHPA